MKYIITSSKLKICRENLYNAKSSPPPPLDSIMYSYPPPSTALSCLYLLALNRNMIYTPWLAMGQLSPPPPVCLNTFLVGGPFSIRKRLWGVEKKKSMYSFDHRHIRILRI